MNFKINHKTTHIIKIGVFNKYTITVYSRIHRFISPDYIIIYKDNISYNKMSYLEF